METPAKYSVTPAGKRGYATQEKSNGRSTRAAGHWNGTRRSDGTFNKPLYRDTLCPMMSEYCKGPKCAWYLADTEMCAVVQAAGALHHVAIGGRSQSSRGLVESLAKTMEVSGDR